MPKPQESSLPLQTQEAFNQAVDVRVRAVLPVLLADLFGALAAGAARVIAGQPRPPRRIPKISGDGFKCQRAPHKGRHGKKCREAAEAVK